MQNDFYELRKDSWKKSAENYNVWISAAERNLFLAEYLCKKYLETNEKIVTKSNKFLGGTITRGEWNLSSIHKEVLMFYGFAIECYLKALLVKEEVIEIFDEKNEFKLHEKLCKHLSVGFYEDYKENFPKINNNGKKHIGYLHRAILSGKYPFEKSPSKYFAYTAYFNNTVTFSKKLIFEIKKLLE